MDLSCFCQEFTASLQQIPDTAFLIPALTFPSSSPPQFRWRSRFLMKYGYASKVIRSMDLSLACGFAWFRTR